MKTCALCAAVLLASFPATAQVASTTVNANDASVGLRVTPRDANSSSVEWVEQLTNALSGQVTARNHRYVQVGTGLITWMIRANYSLRKI